MDDKEEEKYKDKAEQAESPKQRTCGIVMPISAIDGCEASHWKEVLDIITAACGAAGFEASLVSEAGESGIIHKDIVRNLYHSDMVVVDVSAKNPNVMFELGMRLAFDKPAVIIKDDVTSYSFDTGVIQHLPYRRDLHYFHTLEFQKKLAAKLQATHQAALADEDYSTFLKHFVDYDIKAKGLETKSVGAFEFLVKGIQELRDEMAGIRGRLPALSAIEKPGLRAQWRIDIVNFVASCIIDYRRFHSIPESTKLSSNDVAEFVWSQSVEARSSFQDRDRLATFAAKEFPGEFLS